MTGFFDRMLGRNTNKGSGAKAKDRLKFVLLHERINIAPEKMREMKQEIIAVIAKYVPEIDPDTVDIAFEQSDRYNNKLVAEIPFTKTRSVPAKTELDENGITSHLDVEFDAEIVPQTEGIAEAEDEPDVAEQSEVTESDTDDTLSIE